MAVAGGGGEAESTGGHGMTFRLWNVDWSTELPWQFGDVVVERASFGEAAKFMRQHVAQEANARFFVEEMTEAKRRFCEDMDVFLFKAEGETVGVYTGNPVDWGSYYVRTVALAEAYQNRGLVLEIDRNLSRVLAPAGVERLEAETSVANQAMLRFFGVNGWIPTGTVNTDRWGAMLRFTKFLRDDVERVFRRQYVYVPDLSSRSSSTQERRKP